MHCEVYLTAQWRSYIYMYIHVYTIALRLFLSIHMYTYTMYIVHKLYRHAHVRYTPIEFSAPSTTEVAGFRDGSTLITAGS